MANNTTQHNRKTEVKKSCGKCVVLIGGKLVPGTISQMAQIQYLNTKLETVHNPLPG